MGKLPVSFYQDPDVVSLAKQLLGKQLFTLVDGELTGGIITETEAYRGVSDKASHAYGGRFTPRTEVMYKEGGISYVYLCYGIHHLLNVVTAAEGTPHAVLIRGIEPQVGIDIMLHRRNKTKLQPQLTAGPGALSQALAVDRTLNGKTFSGDEIWIEDRGILIPDQQIVASKRIGIAYAQEHAELPWRFYIRGNRFVSKPNKG